MEKNTINLALFGFGHVGQGFYQTLPTNTKPIIEIVGIAVKNREKVRPFPDLPFIFNYQELLQLDNIQLIVEATDDTDVAWEIIKTGLIRGIPVVSANKKLLATRFEEILRLSLKTGTPIFYEAAAAASIPIFQTIDQYYRYEKIEAISGIVNGTTNFILAGMTERGARFEDMLAEAQEKGFAESNPTSDIDAWDAAYKAVLLAAHAYGDILNPNDIIRYGIRYINTEDIEYARKLNKKIRLIFQAKKEKDRLSITVLPTLVDSESAFYAVSDAYNAIKLNLTYSGEQLLTGKGAGSLPTGATMVKNVLQALENKPVDTTKKKFLATLPHKPALEIELLLRLPKGYTTEHWPKLELTNRIEGENHDRIQVWVHGEALIKYLPEWHELQFSLIATGKTRLVDDYKKTLVASIEDVKA